MKGIVKKSRKPNQKTGLQILKIYKTLKKNGVTAEDAIFYLLVHMDKVKADEIGMDMNDSKGNTKRLLVSIIRDNAEQKFINTMVS